MRVPFSRSVLKALYERAIYKDIVRDGWVFSGLRLKLIYAEFLDWERYYCPVDVCGKVVLDVGAGSYVANANGSYCTILDFWYCPVVLETQNTQDTMGDAVYLVNSAGRVIGGVKFTYDDLAIHVRDVYGQVDQDVTFLVSGDSGNVGISFGSWQHFTCYVEPDVMNVYLNGTFLMFDSMTRVNSAPQFLYLYSSAGNAGRNDDFLVDDVEISSYSDEVVSATPSPSPVPSAIGGESSGGFVVYFVILVLFAVVAVVAGLWLTAGDDSMNKGVALLFAFVAFVVFMVLFFGSGWFG